MSSPGYTRPPYEVRLLKIAELRRLAAEALKRKESRNRAEARRRGKAEQEERERRTAERVRLAAAMQQSTENAVAINLTPRLTDELETEIQRVLALYPRLTRTQLIWAITHDKDGLPVEALAAALDASTILRYQAGLNQSIQEQEYARKNPDKVPRGYTKAAGPRTSFKRKVDI